VDFLIKNTEATLINPKFDIKLLYSKWKHSSTIGLDLSPHLVNPYKSNLGRIFSVTNICRNKCDKEFILNQNSEGSCAFLLEVL